MTSYWNDIEVEKKKPFWIETEEDPKLLNFLQKGTNLQKCFEDSLQFAKSFGGLQGNVLEIGAGVAWTSAIISKNPEVKEVTALDFSETRLLKIAPLVFKQLKGDFAKFRPVVGDFLGQDFGGAERFDAVVFCQALYMFSNMYEVLDKVYSLVRPGGVVIIACERITPNFPKISLRYYKRLARKMLFGRADATGNNFYIDVEYKKALEKVGFAYHFQSLPYSVYHDSGINAGNHFGIKV